MKILFIDHACHKKTKSADFFLDLLRSKHEVIVHYYDHYYDCKLTKNQIDAADLIVFWEFLPGRFNIAIPDKPCLFVPMYDNEWGSDWQWKRIADCGMSVLSFCDKVTAHAKKCGVRHILTVHYAINPQKYATKIKLKSHRAIYWDRGGFSEMQIKALFSENALAELVVQREFMAVEKYENFLSNFDVYIAPRAKEGIGMAFLEQLARGKCVVAHNDATMNEYIIDGENGLLRDFTKSNKRPISTNDIDKILQKNINYAENFYLRWLNEQNSILPFIENAAQNSILRYKGVSDCFRFVMSVFEYCFKVKLGKYCHFFAD